MKVTCVKVELPRQNRKAGVTPFAMNKITQEMRFRQAVIEYSLKYGATKAAIRYKTNRQYIYRWRKRYDGTLQSLADRSHRPHSHPKQHTESELIRYAPQKPECRAGCLLGEAASTRLLSLYFGSVSGFAAYRTRCGEAPESKVYPKTI